MSSNVYPEHAKLRRIKDESQAIGEFLEAMQMQGKVLCGWREDLTDSVPCLCVNEGRTAPSERCPLCHGGGWREIKLNPQHLPVSGTIPDLLAAYFEIDKDAIEREKRAMLAELRAAS